MSRKAPNRGKSKSSITFADSQPHAWKRTTHINEGYGLATAARPQYHGVVHALRSIFTTQGFTGLYQGVTPNVWGAGASWGLYFFFYNSLKTWMQDGDTTRALGWSKHLACASEAGLFTLILTNPIWVTKTRLCLQYERGASVKSDGVIYKGTADALVKIYRLEGLRGLYKGFVPGVFGISHGAIQFMTYEEMKNYYNRIQHRPVDTRLTSIEYLTFAALSKVVAAVTTYPYQVLRARLQDQHRSYSGVRDVTAQIIKYEGLKGFYKGLTPNLLRVTPACCITFVVYEYLITKLLHSNNGNGDNNNGNKLVDKVDEIKATDNNKLESNDR